MQKECWLNSSAADAIAVNTSGVQLARYIGLPMQDSLRLTICNLYHLQSANIGLQHLLL